MADPVGADLRPRTPRPGPVDQEPGARLGRALGLLDDIDRAARLLQPLLRTVERMTGLSPALVGRLMSFADSGELSVGSTEDSTGLTALAHKGLVRSDEATPGAERGRTRWCLTDAGWVALEQVQGLRIRVLGAIVGTLDDGQVAGLRGTLRGIGDAFESFHPAVGTSRPASP